MTEQGRKRTASISTLIVSYNDRAIMCRCLAALRKQMTAPEDEIIVVDNGSTDGVLEDLRELAASDAAGIAAEGAEDEKRPIAAVYLTEGGNRRFACPLKLIENGENAGFPVGCNIGFAAARPGNDIFLLNNDAVLAEGALDNLRRTLYSAEDIGAVGAVSNNALEQIESGAPQEMEAALAFGAALSARIRPSCECRSRLTGFAVLIKRAVADRLVETDGYFLDPRFSPGYFEDEDLGVRVALAGYRQLLCHNAFIYHKGGTGFASHPEAMARGREKFIEKWGFDVWAYIGILDDYEDAVQSILTKRTELAGESHAAVSDHAGQETARHAFPLRILEIDCGMGVNLAHLQYLYPDSTVIGIERNPLIARIAAQLIDVICAEPEEALANAETAGTPEAKALPAGAFDLIFAWDACARSADPEGMRMSLRRLLRENGQVMETLFQESAG